MFSFTRKGEHAEIGKKGGGDKEKEILTTCQQHMLLGDSNGVDGSICATFMPLVALKGQMGGLQEIGEKQLKEKGDKPYPHQEQCSSSSTKEGMEDFGHPRHGGYAVRGAAEERQVIIDGGEIEMNGHITTEEDEITHNENRAGAYQNVTDGGDSAQDGEVVLLEVREGKTGGSSTTTASLTPKKSAADICSIVSSPLDHQGYCTTPSQEMVEQPLILRINLSPRGAGAGAHATRVTPQRLKNSSSEVVIEETSNRKEKCNGNIESVSVIQKLAEKDVDNAVSIAGGDLADPSISKYSGTVPRNPYMDTNKIVSLSESCKFARAQSAAGAAATAAKTRTAGDDDYCLEENSLGTNVCNVDDASDDVQAGKRGRFLLRPERNDCCTEDACPETAAYSISDTQQVEVCKHRLADLESPSPIQPSQLSLLGGDGTNVDARFSSSSSKRLDLERSGLPLSLSSEAAEAAVMPREEPARHHSKKQPLPPRFCVAFCALSEEQERVSVGLLRILQQDRVVLEENISLVYLPYADCYSVLFVQDDPLNTDNNTNNANKLL